jgi:hypothetical protein
VVPVDVVAWVDAAARCDDRHAHDAYNDARYDKHVDDAEPADDVVRQAAGAGAAVPADVVVAGRMQILLITGINMRIYTFSYHTDAKAIP